MAVPVGLIIYGANGYTGQLIAREAARRGLRPTLAGRRREAIAALAAELDCPVKVFELDDPAAIAVHLAGAVAVLNCAGPFARTAVPMMEACLIAGAHYLDITGEIDVIESAAARSECAKQARVSLIPAVGFDVVPSDCLAALVAERLPGATRLQLAFAGMDSISPGTAKTALESLPQGGRARIDGQIRRVPVAWKTIDVPFRHRIRTAVSIPWGDLASAYYSTGISNIETYMAMPRKQIAWMRRLRPLLPLLGWKPILSLARRRIERRVHGPTELERQSSHACLWGRASDDDGHAASATLVTPGGYQLTTLTAVAALQRVLTGHVPPGFLTPSQAFGKQFILEIPATDLRWEE